MTVGQRLLAALTARTEKVSYTALAGSGVLASPGVICHPSRFGRLCVYTALVLCLLAGVSVYSRRENLPSGVGMPSFASPPSSPVAQIRKSREQYIEAVLRNPVEGLLDPEPLRKKCNETQFQEGLVWHCSTVVGGIGNVGNMWLNCVRYAIEAGATTLILPRLGARDNNLIDLGNKDRSVDLSTLFDVDHFLASWQDVCPQIRAVVSDAEVPELAALPAERAPHLAPSRVKAFPMRKYLIVDPTGWREAFDAWLAKAVSGPPVSAAHPVRVWQDMVLAQWNSKTEPEAFRTAFPRLFRYPEQTRRLAAAVLWQLEQRLGRPVVSDEILQPQKSSSSVVNALGPGRLAPDGFFGAHMRVAADAAAAGWPGYEAQAPFFLHEAQARNMTAIYLATGSAEHRAQFIEDAANATTNSGSSLAVFSKEDLLDDADEQAALQALSWDQQALVDFDVLLHSAYFYGAVRSSFSWALALRRGTLPEAGSSQVTEALGDEYRDSLSAVVGRYPNINPEGMWP